MSPLTCGVCELEGDGFVRDTADIADRHLACVAGIILRPKVLQLQDFGLTLGFGKIGAKKDTGVQSTDHHSKSISCPKVYRLPAAPMKTLGKCADFKPLQLYLKETQNVCSGHFTSRVLQNTQQLTDTT